MEPQDYSEEYRSKSDDELLVIAAHLSELVPEAAAALNAEISSRGLKQNAQSRTAESSDLLDRTPAEWQKRRSQFRWIWMAFGALLAVGVILMDRCNGR
jgi:hypothetical protein